MTKLQLAVYNNYIEWWETPTTRVFKLKLIKWEQAFLIKQWMKENHCTKEQALAEMGKFILAVVYDIKEDEDNENNNQGN